METKKVTETLQREAKQVRSDLVGAYLDLIKFTIKDGHSIEESVDMVEAALGIEFTRYELIEFVVRRSVK